MRNVVTALGLAEVKRKVSLLIRDDIRRRFRGRFADYTAAMSNVRPGHLAGYDHAEIADVAFEQMCAVTLWDYPVLFWLGKLLPRYDNILDAAGHMGTKYRAWRDLLDLPADFEWIVYEVPAIAEAGRRRALKDGLGSLRFHDDLAAVPPSDVMLGSGLLQYLDEPFAAFMRRLPRLPEHLLLNKVAVRDGETVVTLEVFPGAEVPYLVLGRAAFEASLAELGYKIIDQWEIGDLSFKHPAFGQSSSQGYYARLDPQRNQ
ncbi:methyltransferase, TIGR04325 family [Novosphingobium sp.]|uniref:methyltransferase, TIGR04325 family n=1 Tax=Novosphingobium sp. TaxID=1874826 RepID=UPI0025FA1E75|nr:methyltransferase, TIGR04325 family [Novosphingobium sp.]